MNISASLHPAVLAVYFLTLLVVLIFNTNPVITGIGVLGGAGFLFMLRGSAGFVRTLAGYLVLCMIIAFTNPLFVHAGVTPLFFINGKPVTLEAFVYGLTAGAALVSVMLWCQCLGRVVTTDKLLYLLGRTIPQTALLLTMSLRFLPLFLRQRKKIADAQKGMGICVEDSLMQRMRAGMRIFSALTGWAMENAMDTACSMKARGYGMKGRTNFSLFRFEKRDVAVLLLTVLLSAVTIAGIGNGTVSFDCYPAVTCIPSGKGAVIVYGAFLIQAFLPFAMELWASIRWNYDRSHKINGNITDEAGFVYLSEWCRTGIRKN